MDAACPSCAHPKLNRRRSEKEPIRDVVVKDLFRAYFTEGQYINNHQTLSDIVAEAGLDRQLVEDMLSNDEGVSTIQNAEELSRRHGVSGVPFFIFNEKVALSGAQAPDTFLEEFRQVTE